VSGPLFKLGCSYRESNVGVTERLFVVTQDKYITWLFQTSNVSVSNPDTESF
jgi:hypothetical protein